MLYHIPEHPFRVPFTARVRQAIHALAAARRRRRVARLVAFAMLSKDQKWRHLALWSGSFRW
jgi:hypothetical protein